MGELVPQEVRKSPILFNIPLKYFEDYFQAILSICTAVVPLMLKYETTVFRTPSGDDLWQTYKPEH